MGKNRRRRGDGGITLRKDGRWMGQVELGWHDGRRRRRAVYGATEAECAGKLAELKQTIATTGRPPVPQRDTVGTFLRRWLELCRARLRPRSYERYDGICRRLLIPRLGRHRLELMTPQDVAEVLCSIEQESTAARARGAREVLRKLREKGLAGRVVENADREKEHS